ncbi:hypothetical protein P3S68_026562 [Capsicum galapagoense]
MYIICETKAKKARSTMSSSCLRRVGLWVRNCRRPPQLTDEERPLLTGEGSRQVERAVIPPSRDEESLLLTGQGTRQVERAVIPVGLQADTGDEERPGGSVGGGGSAGGGLPPVEADLKALLSTGTAITNLENDQREVVEEMIDLESKAEGITSSFTNQLTYLVTFSGAGILFGYRKVACAEIVVLWFIVLGSSP